MSSGSLSRAAVLALFLYDATAAAQSRPLTFYYQNVPLWSRDTSLSQGGLSDFNRFRIMSETALGDFSFHVAYEQVATFRENDTQGLFVGRVPSGGEWLELQWEIEDEEHVLWQHRFDRLQIGWNPGSKVELNVGRQVVSWATTLFLTPSDPFSPFSPADPFREFRAGVDAARVRFYPGPLSEIDVVVRPTGNPGRPDLGDELTVLGRGLATWKGWELSGWGGSLYGNAAGAFGATGSIGSSALRSEGVVRELENDVVFRGTLGFDHLFSIKKRDLFVVLELQRDGLGAASADEYVAVLASKPFLRGEMQVLGRDEAVIQGSFQLHPLLSLQALTLFNLDDGSVLLSPSFSYSASNEATVTGGLFLGFGDDEVTPERPLASEYGAVGTTVYVSVSLFF